LKASKPWLSCPMAGQESIFMVSIDGGSTHLKQLSYPTPDLFMQMTDFSQNEMQQLTKKIILNMCDCQRLPDGSLPAGCVLPSPRPTTPVPITTPKVPISKLNFQHSAA
uniref:Tensin 3 n=1 Tax=Anisakis simplex TaxID=6269 RepID=A0A0M3KK67_ANISI